MAQIEVVCPLCQQNNVVKFGLTAQGKQRYLCNHTTCENKTFILDYKNKGYLSQIKKQIVDMAINGSGIRDTARVLGIGVNTVIKALKKRKAN